MNKLIMFLGLFVMFTSFCLAKDVTVFYEDFEDGDYTYNPNGDLNFGVCTVLSHTLVCDGAKVDSSNRFSSWINYYYLFNTSSKLVFSYDVSLLSPGNPQEGIGVQMWLNENSNSDKHYDLRIARGYTNGFPINHYSISLGDGAEGTLHDYIFSNFTPEINTKYFIKAIRDNGKWSLYINNFFVGEYQDTLNLTSFNKVIFSMVGSVIIDNINVTVSVPDDEPEINQDLIKYAPIIYLHPEENYIPKEIISVLDYSDLRKDKTDLVKTAPLAKEDISNLEDSKKFNLDMINVDTEGIGVPPSEDFSKYSTTIYGREIEGEGGYKFFQYFLFYPFQEWYLMNHEGDWEMIQVNVDPNNKVESVQYMFNFFTMTYYDTDLLNMYNKTHPPLLVGLGSHNNFGDLSPISFDSKYLFFMNLFGRFKELEKLSTEGIVLKPTEVETEDNEINYEIEEISSSIPWVNFEGRWGQTTPFSLRNGPKGPKYNPLFYSKWREPETFTYAPEIPFLSVFLYSPLDMKINGENGELIDETSENTLFYTGPNEEPEMITVTGNKNYTLELDANEEGQFTLELYYYDNETDKGIMVRYENISNKNRAKGRVEVNQNSFFILYIDENGDSYFERPVLPKEVITYNDFSYVLPDKDEDEINDFIDNCPDLSNPDQLDFNNDGKGDVCDNPRYYKRNVLAIIQNKDSVTKKEKIKLELAEKAIASCLNDRYWNDDFSIKTAKVFIEENVAASHLDKNLSMILAKADSLIVEKELLKKNQTTKSREETKRYLLAQRFFELGNKHYQKQEPSKSILSYMNCWLLLKTI